MIFLLNKLSFLLFLNRVFVIFWKIQHRGTSPSPSRVLTSSQWLFAFQERVWWIFAELLLHL